MLPAWGKTKKSPRGTAKRGGQRPQHERKVKRKGKSGGPEGLEEG